MRDISQILKSLGLLDSEIKTYLAAFEGGPGTVLDLTKKTRLSRQATYVAIETLGERGLMSSALRGKKRFYSAEPPSKLLAYAKRREVEMNERIKDLERALPEMELAKGGERPVVRLFEGRDAIIAFYDAMIAEKPKELDEIADVEALNIIISEEQRKFIRETMRKFGIHGRVIYTGEPRPSGEMMRRYYLPKELSGFKSGIAVFGDKVILYSLEGKIYLAVVENQPIAKGLKVLFELASRALERGSGK